MGLTQLDPYFYIGQMRSVATFYSNTPVPNDSGGRDDNWTVVKSVRARLRKGSGAKKDEQGQVLFNKDYQMICRFNPALAIDPKWKVVIDSEDYRIKDFELVDEIKHWFVFSLAKVSR